MDIGWTHIVTSVLAFVVGLIVKTLLDHNLAIWIVKYLNNTPVRFIYRTNPYKLSGDWEQCWDFENAVDSHMEAVERHSYTGIKQLGKYIYCEFYSGNEKYFFFGEIKNNFVVGTWGDLKDKLAYHGVFDLRLVNSKEMVGKWVGHSKNQPNINSDNWVWKKKN
jgi:hypothetical protein